MVIKITCFAGVLHISYLIFCICYLLFGIFCFLLLLFSAAHRALFFKKKGAFVCMKLLAHKYNICLSRQGRVFFLLVLALVSCFLFAGCQKPEEGQPLRPTPEPHTKVLTTEQQKQAVVYFLDGQGKNLLPLTMEMNETREVALVALQKLLAGAPNDFVKSPLPTNIKVKDLYLENGSICVDLTEEFLQIEADAVEPSLACIVATVGGFSPAKQVKIFVEGNLVEKIGEVPVSQPLAYTAVNPYQDGKILDPEESVAVYYGDDQAMYLVPVSFPAPEEDPYTFVAEKLVAGPPRAKGLMKTVYQGTKLNGVTVADGIATVDLSKEAVAYGGGTAFEYLFVQSVLATFAQFPAVEQVQFLLDGKTYALLPEGTELDMPLPVNQTVNYIVANDLKR